MALLLWSPVVIPLLPTLVPFWAMKASTGIIGDACVIGLYAAVTILVIIWGKRIRGYEDPVVHYGLDVMSTTRVSILIFLFCFSFISTSHYISSYMYAHTLVLLPGVEPEIMIRGQNFTIILEAHNIPI